MRVHTDRQHTASGRPGPWIPSADRFNTTGFSRWVNGTSGRVFRLLAGASFLVLGLTQRGHWWGVAAGVWSFFPLSAGLFDICWISAALGGPLSGRTIRGRAGRTDPVSGQAL